MGLKGQSSFEESVGDTLQQTDKITIDKLVEPMTSKAIKREIAASISVVTSPCRCLKEQVLVY